MDLNYLKQEPGLVETLEDDAHYGNEQQSVQDVLTPTDTGSENEACNTGLGDLLNVKHELDIGPTVLQHMDMHYTVNQNTSTVTESNTNVVDCNKPMPCTGVKMERIEDNLRDPKDSKYHCDKCMKTFKLKQNLKRHCQNMHGAEYCKCALCNREFKSMLYLRIHTKNVHSNEQYECNICKEIFKSKEGLSHHLYNCHSLRLPDPEYGKYFCDKCLKTFRFKVALQTHCKVMHGTERHKCIECDRDFRRITNLRNHINKVHSNQRFACDICKKIFKSKRNLDRHISRRCCHRPAATMEHVAKKSVMDQLHMEMAMRIEVEEAAPSLAYVHNEIQLKQDPELVQHMKSEPRFLVQEGILMGRMQGTDEQKGVPATITGAIESRTCVAADSVGQGQLLHVREELEDKNLDLCIGPTVFQHMDPHYRTSQMMDFIGQKNTILNINEETEEILSRIDGGQAKCSQVRESSGKHPEYGEYFCDKCLKTFQLKRALNTHCKIMHGTERHKCIECNSEFKSIHHLRNHVKNVHSKQEFACDICKKIFKSKRNLDRHISRSCCHRPDPEYGEHFCDKCLKTFQSKGALKTHCKVIHGTERHKCIECNSEFKTISNLRAHVEDVHSKQELACDICRKIFNSKRKLDCHISRRCCHRPGLPKPKDSNYTCDKCKKTLNSKITWRRHCQDVHGTEYYKCVECIRVYRRMSRLQEHINNVHSKKHYECDICKKIVKTKNSVRNHILNCHMPDPKDSNNQCEKCMKTFKSKIKLKSHCQHVHGTEYYKCIECSREFKCMSYLRQHVYNMHSNKQYECEIRKKSFKSKKAVRRHILICHLSGADSTSLAADSAERVQLVQIKEELDIGPTVLQHMDSYYRNNQVKVEHVKMESSPRTDEQTVKTNLTCP